MRRSVFDGPFLHCVRNDVGYVDVERLALFERLRECFVRGAGKSFLHDVIVENECSVLLVDSSHLLLLKRFAWMHDR